MQKLPLFPLPLVLYPGAVIPLHIFEPRYRLMVDHCLEGNREFGLLHHDCDERGPFLMEPGRVGTVARIDEHRALPDGRSLILIRGQSRFRIVAEHEMTELYYQSDVEPYLDERVPRQDAIREARMVTLQLFTGLLDALDETPEELPEFDLNLDLSFQLAPAVQIDMKWQQSFLELRAESARLERLDAVFQAAVETREMDS